MRYLLGDIFIGEHPLIASFASRAQTYAARYGLRGHNGLDFATPVLTPVLATNEGVVVETGFNAAGYGNFVKLLHSGFLSLYAHLNDVTVLKDEHVISGQLIGHSGNTGLSDTPHLHFGVAPTDNHDGKILADNGFSGFIDPRGEECEWVVKNLEAPAVAHAEIEQSVPIDPGELSIKNNLAANFQVVLSYLASQPKAAEYIKKLDPTLPESGAAVNLIIDELLTGTMGQESEAIPLAPNTGLFQTVKNFIFT